MEMARLKEGQITFYNLDGDEITREMTQIEWNAEAAEKGGFEHFMMKEIHEQPKAVSDTLNSVLKNGRLDLTEIGLTEEEICAIIIGNGKTIILHHSQSSVKGIKCAVAIRLSLGIGHFLTVNPAELADIVNHLLPVGIDKSLYFFSVHIVLLLPPFLYGHLFT